jgi:hypothetical protein
MAPLPIKFTEICQLTQLPSAGIQVSVVDAAACGAAEKVELRD